MTTTKPLFIPLRSEYYDAFADGSKTMELREYGPRWNERTCKIGRAVILSKGYGKKNRMVGRVVYFSKIHGADFGSESGKSIKSCYGTLNLWIACISVGELRVVEA